MPALQLINASVHPEVQMNENFDALSAVATFAKDAPNCTGLTWAYLGGIYKGTTVANGTIALTDNATNYVVVLRSTGVVSKSTTTTNWLDTAYARLYKVTTVSGVVTVIEDHRTDTNGLLLALPPASPTTQVLSYLIGSQGVALTAGAGKLTVRVPFAFDLWDLRASVSGAPTGADLLADVNQNGVSIFATVITIAAGQKSVMGAGGNWDYTSYPLSLADDDELTFDIDQIGSIAAGNGPLQIQLVGNITP